MHDIPIISSTLFLLNFVKLLYKNFTKVSKWNVLITYFCEAITSCFSPGAPYAPWLHARVFFATFLGSPSFPMLLNLIKK